MQFKEIIGGDKVKNYLTQSYHNKRLAHAYLFEGGVNSPKLLFAFAFAQYINCFNPQKNDSCGECSSCIKHKSLNHPDLHLVFPVLSIRKIKKPISDNFLSEWKKETRENPYLNLEQWFNSFSEENNIGKTGHIYTHEAESLKQKLSLKNYEAKYRIVIVWMPEKMQTNTSNKLLKTLEEPPKNTIFILVTEESGSLLRTIKSRLQSILMKDHDDKEKREIVNCLFQDKRANEEIALTYKKNNQNLSRVILSLNKNTQESGFLNEYKDWMRICYLNDIQSMSEWMNKITRRGRAYQVGLLRYSLKMIRNSMVLNFTEKLTHTINTEEKDFLSKFHKYIHEKNVLDITIKTEDCIRHINRNGNLRILIYELSLQYMRLLKLNRKFVTNKN